MGLVLRKAADRRGETVEEFPLTDKLGNRVVHDRRSYVQRRRSIATLEELLILFSEQPSIDPNQRSQRHVNQERRSRDPWPVDP